MPTAPYDTIETALNLLRVRTNDSILGLAGAGGVLTDARPQTLVIVNAAWRKMQGRLFTKGFTPLEKEVVLAIPPAASPDTATQSWIDWTGFFDGVSQQSSPVLPQDLIQPRQCSERTTANTLMTEMEMSEVTGGLPGVPKKFWLEEWEWRQNKLYLIGAILQTNLRIRYASYLPDFTDPVAGPTQPIPIMRCLSPFAWYMAYESGSQRGDMSRQEMLSLAEAETDELMISLLEQPKSSQDMARIQHQLHPDTPPAIEGAQ